MKIILYEFKAMLFEIYSAGYVDALNSKNDSAIDLKTSFDKYYAQLERMINND